MATTNQAIELAIITTVNDNGELLPAEIVENVASLFVSEDDAPAETQKTRRNIERMIIKLDRDGKLTRQNAESGFQLTANGKSSIDGLRAKMESRYIAPYAQFSTVRAYVELVTSTLGHKTGPGNEGISLFPRLMTRTRFDGKLIQPGGPIILGGSIRTAWIKAANKGDATVTIDRAGARRTLPDVAWSRVGVQSVFLPADQEIIREVRRPVNDQGKPVGEIIHEAVPAGTKFPIIATFPLSHFSESYLIRLFEQIERTGVSAVGMGKGGMWGLMNVLSLKVDGREIWPYAELYDGEDGQTTYPDPIKIDTAPMTDGLLTVGDGTTAVSRAPVVVGAVRHINGAK